MRMGKGTCTAAPWSVDDSGQPVNNSAAPRPTRSWNSGLWRSKPTASTWPTSSSRASSIPSKEMMPNYEPPPSSADGGKIDLEEVSHHPAYHRSPHPRVLPLLSIASCRGAASCGLRRVWR